MKKVFMLLVSIAAVVYLNTVFKFDSYFDWFMAVVNNEHHACRTLDWAKAYCDKWYDVNSDLLAWGSCMNQFSLEGGAQGLEELCQQQTNAGSYKAAMRAHVTHTPVPDVSDSGE